MKKIVCYQIPNERSFTIDKVYTAHYDSIYNCYYTQDDSNQICLVSTLHFIGVEEYRELKLIKLGI